MSDFPQSTHNTLAGLKEFLDRTRDLPPTPHCFIARHDVPPGRPYRYWDTRGRLIVYVNRASIEALPKAVGGRITIRTNALMPFGIPVRYEEVQ